MSWWRRFLSLSSRASEHIAELLLQQTRPDSSYARLLQECGSLSEGKRLHAHLVDKRLLQKDGVLADCLVQMYIRCESVLDARQALYDLPEASVFSWTALIQAYAQLGHCKEALQIYGEMQLDGVMPERVTFLAILNACGKLEGLSEGRLIHARIKETPFEGDLAIGTALIRMYGKCRSIEEAAQVFSNIHEKNVISWTAMIAMYVECDQCKEALQFYRRMQLEGVMPDRVTLLTVLNVCCNPGALLDGKVVHARIVQSGLDCDVVVRTALVNMYGKCGLLEDARNTFEKMPHRNKASWTAMISAYLQHSHCKQAFHVFQEMLLEGLKPDKVTFITVMNTCVDATLLRQGKMVHSWIVEGGFQGDVTVGNALVNMYGKCGSLEDASQVFNNMQRWNVVTCNTMIAVYIQYGHHKQALELFRGMQLLPDRVTLINILNACGSLEDLAEGKLIHSDIAKGGFDSDIVVGNAIVNMYGKCKSLQDARKMFDKMSQRNVVSWNSMLGAYTQGGRCKEALELFRRMQLVPDKVTFTTILNACANLAALAEGKRIHAQIRERGFLSDAVLGNAIIDMYAKCGRVEDAHDMFQQIQHKNVVSWTAMVTAYAQHGQCNEALQSVCNMHLEGVMPNAVTFVNVLSACNHAGLVYKGSEYFCSMIRDYGLVPHAEHYSSIIDLLGRAGRLDEAEGLIHMMMVPPDLVVWMTLLGACRMQGDLERGKRAAERVLELDPQNAAAYRVMYNIYARGSRWDDAAKIRRAMLGVVRKETGNSWIEVNDIVHEFAVGDSSHPQAAEIYAELERLSKAMEETGYVPDTTSMLHDVEEEQKEHLLCYHSEKLAIAFGLISTAPQAPLLIIKNLRVCGDCHAATKFISKLVQREVVVRDARRFHHFRNGVCSCGDYW